MSSKKDATEALQELSLLVESLTPEFKGQALGMLARIQRFVGELRQEKAALKQRAEEVEAYSKPLQGQIDKLKVELADAQGALGIAKSKLESLEQALRGAKKQLVAATDSQARLAHLVPGPKQPSPGTREERQAERQKRRKQLHTLLPELLPNFNLATLDSVDVIAIHQDSFAAGYHADEYTLLGMAIKFAGDHGRAVTITGWCGENCGEEWAEEVAQLRKQSGE